MSRASACSTNGLDAASAAFEVGYESASQFNREYSRFFGQPPMRDVKARRLEMPRQFPSEVIAAETQDSGARGRVRG